MFVVLKPWGERRGAANSVEAIITKVDELSKGIEEAVVFSVNPSVNTRSWCIVRSLEMQLLDINNLGPKEIAQTIDEIQQAAADYPELKQITSLYQGRKWRNTP